MDRKPLPSVASPHGGQHDPVLLWASLAQPLLATLTVQVFPGPPAHLPEPACFPPSLQFPLE